MKGDIHPELQQYLPKPHTAFYTVVCAAVLLSPFILALGATDDPVGFLTHLPQSLLQILPPGQWRFIIRSVLITLLMLAFSSIVLFSDRQESTTLRAASETLASALPELGQLVVWSVERSGLFAYVNVPHDPAATPRWRLNVLKAPSGFTRMDNSRRTLEGKIYRRDDVQAPVVVKTAEGVFIAGRMDEQLHKRWSALALPARKLPAFMRAAQYMTSIAFLCTVFLTSAMPLAALRSLVHAIQKMSTWEIILAILGVMLFGAMTYFLIQLFRLLLRNDRMRSHLLQHGILGKAIVRSSTFVRKYYWPTETTEYLAEITTFTERGKAQEASVRLDNLDTYLDTESVSAVLYDPQRPEPMLPLVKLEEQYKPHFDATGNLRVPLVHIPLYVVAVLFILLIAVVGMLAWWMVLFHPQAFM